MGGNPLSRIDPTGELTAGAVLVGGGVLIVGGVIYMSGPAGKKAIRSAATAISNAFCSPGDQDPCKGLRDILKDHEDKLQNYLNDPLGSDNKGILSMAYLANNGAMAMSIYEGRIRNLKNQIANFKKQLEECERMNGKK